MQKPLIKLIRFFVTGCYAFLIFYLSSRTWSGGPELFPHADKIIHFLIYSLLGGLCLWSLRVTRFRYSVHITALAILATSAYGASDEIHQSFVPGRDSTLGDLSADIVGSFAGVSLAYFLARRLRGENKC